MIEDSRSKELELEKKREGALKLDSHIIDLMPDDVTDLTSF